MTTAARPTFKSRVRVTAWLLLVLLAVALLAVGADGPLAVVLPSIIAAAALTVMIWALVRTRRQREEYEQRLTSWATRHATQLERLRLARELHDIVSHGLGVVTVCAAAAGRFGERNDSDRVQALAEIEKISRETTVELRRMLLVLRQPGDETPPLRPTETLADLPEIVEETARRAGLSMTCAIPEIDGVPPAVQSTVCVIVREALTNTARHAGPTEVRVAVRRDGDSIVTSVRDAGPVSGWRPELGAGQGLVGLRERVSALGGALTAEPIEGGFHLLALVPTGGTHD